MGRQTRVGTFLLIRFAPMRPLTYTYQLIVFHNQCTSLEVRATCAEEACQIMRKTLSGPDFGILEFDRRELLDEWLVMRVTPFEYCHYLHIEAWDGERFRSFGKAMIGDDIVSAIRARYMHHLASVTVPHMAYATA